MSLAVLTMDQSGPRQFPVEISRKYLGHLHHVVSATRVPLFQRSTSEENKSIHCADRSRYQSTQCNSNLHRSVPGSS